MRSLDSYDVMGQKLRTSLKGSDGQMSAMWGADADELDQLGGIFENAGSTLSTISSNMSALLSQASWIGSDAEEFHSDWTGRSAVALQTVAQRLHDAATVLHQNATQQRQASEADSSGSVGAGQARGVSGSSATGEASGAGNTQIIPPGGVGPSLFNLATQLMGGAMSMSTAERVDAWVGVAGAVGLVGTAWGIKSAGALSGAAEAFAPLDAAIDIKSILFPDTDHQGVIGQTGQQVAASVNLLARNPNIYSAVPADGADAVGLAGDAGMTDAAAGLNAAALDVAGVGGADAAAGAGAVAIGGGASIADTAAEVATLDATTGEIPIAGQAIVVASGLYLAGDYFYTHDAGFRNATNWTASTAERGVEDYVKVNEDVVLAPYEAGKYLINNPQLLDDAGHDISATGSAAVSGVQDAGSAVGHVAGSAVSDGAHDAGAVGSAGVHAASDLANHLVL
jgi:uncharacterized protein YukE